MDVNHFMSTNLHRCQPLHAEQTATDVRTTDNQRHALALARGRGAADGQHPQAGTARPRAAVLAVTHRPLLDVKLRLTSLVFDDRVAAAQAFPSAVLRSETHRSGEFHTVF